MSADHVPRPVALVPIVDLPLASQVQAVAAVVPERHADTRNAVQGVEASNGGVVTGFPQSQLTIAHLGETGGSESILLAQPNDSAVLGALVTRVFRCWPLLSGIPHTHLLVSRSGDQHGARGIPRQGLDDVGVFQAERGDPGVDIPQLDGQIAGCGRQDVLGGWVEEDLADLARVAAELGHGGDIGGLFGVGEEGEVPGDLPYHDLAIVRGRGNNAVIEGVPISGVLEGVSVANKRGVGVVACAPVGIEDGRSVTAEKGD